MKYVHPLPFALGISLLALLCACDPAPDERATPLTEPTAAARQALAPAAQNDAYNVTPNTPLTIPAPGVLSNDSDPDLGDTL